MASADMRTFLRTGFLNLPIRSWTLIFRSLISLSALPTFISMVNLLAQFLQLLHAPGHGQRRAVLSHVPSPLLLLFPLFLLQQTFSDGQHQTLPNNQPCTESSL